MLRDKEELESAFEALQEETEQNQLIEGGGGDKEIRTLKKIVKNLEVIIKLLVSNYHEFHCKISIATIVNLLL